MALYTTRHNNLDVIIVKRIIAYILIQYFFSKKDITLWREYIELFSQGLALRKIVEKMNKKISYPTAFYWRHKILEVMKHFDNHDKLDGIVEIDETFFE